MAQTMKRQLTSVQAKNVSVNSEKVMKDISKVIDDT
jgi:hypothetical protein